MDFELSKECRNIEFESKEIDSKLANDQLHLALLLASTKIELIYSETIKCVLKINDDQFQALMGRWGLGGYRSAVVELGRLSEEKLRHYKLGQCGGEDLERKRNRLAHEDGYVELLEGGGDEASEVENTLELTIEFIDEVIIDDRRNTIVPDDV